MQRRHRQPFRDCSSSPTGNNMTKLPVVTIGPCLPRYFGAVHPRGVRAAPWTGLTYQSEGLRTRGWVTVGVTIAIAWAGFFVRNVWYLRTRERETRLSSPATSAIFASAIFPQKEVLTERLAQKAHPLRPITRRRDQSERSGASTGLPWFELASISSTAAWGGAVEPLICFSGGLITPSHMSHES